MGSKRALLTAPPIPGESCQLSNPGFHRPYIFRGCLWGDALSLANLLDPDVSRGARQAFFPCRNIDFHLAHFFHVLPKIGSGAQM